MTKKKMIERSWKALENFSGLSPEEQAKILIVAGIVDASGNVLFRTEGQKPMDTYSCDEQ